MALAVLGGLAIGFGSVAGSIYLAVMMIKGSMAVSFWKILAAVALWSGPLLGWCWFGFWIAGASIFSIKKDKPNFEHQLAKLLDR